MIFMLPVPNTNRKLTIDSYFTSHVLHFLQKQFPNSEELHFSKWEVYIPPNDSFTADVTLDPDGKIDNFAGFTFSKTAPVCSYWSGKLEREKPDMDIYYYEGKLADGDEQIYFYDSSDVGQIRLPLKDSLEFVKHSLDGFSWGYSGSGTAQLAFAILLKEFSDPYLALCHYHSFMDKVLALLPKDSEWMLDSNKIRNWMQSEHYKFEATANELIEKIKQCYQPTIIGGKHWTDFTSHQIQKISNTLEYNFNVVKNDYGFVNINCSLKHLPEYVGCVWDIKKIYDLLENDDPNNKEFVVRPFSKIEKKIAFHTAFQPHITILGSYKNVLFHVNLET